MIETGQSSVAPYVATSGGATATHAASRIQAPGSLLSATQGWVAARIRYGSSSTSLPHGGATFDTLFFCQNAGNGIEIMYRETSNDWRTRVYGGGTSVGDAVSAVQTFSAGSFVTVVGKWATVGGVIQAGISVNGGAFTTVNSTLASFTLPALFDIGSEGGTTTTLDSDILWLASGIGTLTNADATTLNALGNTDPNVDTVLGTTANTQFVWTAETAAYFAPGATTQFATPYVHTDGGAQTRAAARVQAPASLIDETQSWIAMRVRMDFAVGTSSFANRAWSWADSTNERIVGLINGTTVQLLRSTGGTSTTAQTTTTYAAGDFLTVVYAWTATQLKVSVNGSVFSTIANTNIPILTATNFDIGRDFNAFAWLNSDVLWTACGTGALTNTDAATLNSLGNTDPHWYNLPTSTGTTMTWSADTTATAGPGNTLDLANSFIDFTSDNSGAYAPGQTDSVPFLSSLNSLTAGGNTFFRINRNSLVNADLGSLAGIRFRLKSLGNMQFVAQALRVYKSGDFTFPTVAVDTKRDTLRMSVPQTGTQSGDPVGVLDPVYFMNVRPKNSVQVVRFNSGHLPSGGNLNQLRLFFRHDFVTGNEIRVNLDSTNATTQLTIAEKTNGVNFVTLGLSSIGAALTPETDYFLVASLTDSQLTASVYKANGAFFSTQLVNNTQVVTRVTRGYTGYSISPYYYDFSIDWVRNSHAEFARFESTNETSIKPILGATLYPFTSPPIDLTAQSFAVSGDVTLTSDSNVGDPAPSTKLVRSGVSFYGGIQTTGLLFIGDTKYARISGKIYPQNSSGQYRVVLIDKNDTVAFIQYISDLKPNQWNEFSVPINANIAPGAYRLVLQNIGTLANTFWIQDFKLTHDAFAWSASPDGGATWYKFYNAINEAYKSANFKSHPGNNLRVRADSLTDNGTISGYTIVPLYGYNSQRQNFALVPSETLAPSSQLTPNS
jgi:hypothetical protein